MAGAQWSGGAVAGGKAAKALLRHDDAQERLEAEHANEDIDKSLTHLNWSHRGESYAQKCARYDARIAEVMEGVRVSSGVNENNTLQSIVIYEPQTLDGQRLDDAQLRVFYDEVWDIAASMFGEENLIDLDVHVDERHNYHDPDKGIVESRVHGHLKAIPAVPFQVKTVRTPVLDADGSVVPLTRKETDPVTGEAVDVVQRYAKDDPLGDDEHGYRWRAGDVKPKTKRTDEKVALPDGEYRLNWNAFASKANIIEFNQRIHAMCQREFGIDYMTGEGKHASRTVEDMKRASRLAAAEKAVEDVEFRAHIMGKHAQNTANLAEEFEYHLDDLKYELAQTHHELEVVTEEVNQARITLDGDDETYGLNDEIEHATSRLDAINADIGAAQRKLESMQVDISEARGKGYEDGYATGKQAVARVQAQAERELDAARLARDAYEQATSRVEGVTIKEIIGTAVSEAFEMTMPEKVKTISGGEKYDKPSEINLAIGRVAQWITTLSHAGQQMIDLLAARVRERLLGRAKLDKDKTRWFEQIDVPQSQRTDELEF